jgi:hypothetical protein
MRWLVAAVKSLSLLGVTVILSTTFIAFDWIIFQTATRPGETALQVFRERKIPTLPHRVTLPGGTKKARFVLNE